MTFKVGDRVTCVDPCFGEVGPQKGHTYTVNRVVPCTVENSGGFIMEVDDIGSWFASRFVLASEAPKPHKWAKEIIAWANGAEIQTREPGSDKDWSDTLNPGWTNYMDYRVKPEKKPDVAYVGHAYQGSASIVLHMEAYKMRGDNVKFTFDGETGKLKAVELIN